MKIIPSKLHPSRTLQSEVEQKKKEAEPQYSAEIKQLIADYEKEAGSEMKKENEQKPPETKNKRRSKSKLKRKMKKPKAKGTKKEPVDSSPRSSDDSDDDPHDGDPDSASQSSRGSVPKRRARMNPEEIRIGVCELVYNNDDMFFVFVRNISF